MKKLLLILLCLPMLGFGQTTYVPDDNFEAYLEANSMGNGIANDDYVTTANINTVDYLNIANQGIFDLTGIEDFLWLEGLYCSNNQLASLDVSYNQYLITLDCSNNYLTSLDVSGATWLLDFYCNNNQLPSLDVSYNISLEWMDCGNNQLTSLDVSNCSSLGLLWCDNNQLASLDVRNSNNINMFFKSLNNPNLTCINVDNASWSTTNWPDIDSWTSFSTNCPPVVFGCINSLACNYNSLANVDDNSCDLPSGCGDPLYIEYSASVTCSDASACLTLIVNGCTDPAYAEYNSLANVDDGSCLTLLATVTFNVNMNTQTVSSDGIHIAGDFQGWDPAATEMFDPDLDGVYSVTVILNQGAYYEYKFINGDAWGQDENMNDWEACSYDDGSCGANCNRLLNVALSTTQDLPAVCFESCINCPVPVSGCMDVTALNYNSLATVDDGSCIYTLTYVPDDNFENYLEANGMGDGIALNDSVLTVNINTVTNLYVFNLNITDLTGVEKFTALEYLQCAFNQLTSLNLSSNSALVSLDCHENQLTSLDVSGANSLNTLLCYNNQLTSLDVSTNTSLTDFNCESNQLTSLDVTSNTVLIDLTCYFNNLTSLDIGINPALNVLLCASNLLTSLDVSGANALYHISCSYNQLTSLDVRNGNNTNMVTFNSTNNPNLTCINVDDVSYSTTNWTNNIDAWSSFSLNCIVPGCTDILACNYDPSATIDDSSCVYLDIIAIATDVSCFGMFDGSIAATAAGGIFPVHYSLGAGLSQTSGTFSNLSADTYYIDATDANNCTSNQMVIITEPAPLSVSVDSTNETAALNDGSATAIISGGTAGYTYLWDDPLAQTTSTATNLAPGLYTVIITDANGCVISDATSVNAYTPTGIINIKNTSKILLKVTDILGKETPHKRNRTLFYIYDDGTVEKRIVIE